MFHVMLILLPIILLGIFGTLLLFGITSILAGILGGASVALLVKHKTVRHLLLAGFSIVLLAGALCLTPFAGLLSPALIGMQGVIGMVILALIAVLAVVGIWIARLIQNEIGKTVLRILFGIVGVCAVALFLFIFSL